MATIHLGDKVRFLNSIGGGTVKRIVSREVVEVEDADGFDIPVSVREIVVIEEAQDAAAANIRTESKRVVEAVETPREDTKKETVQYEETPYGDEGMFGVAVVPQDPQHLRETKFELYLVNDSNFHRLYVVSRHTGEGYRLIEQGMIHCNTTLHLTTFGTEEANDMEWLSVQAVGYKEGKAYPLAEPVGKEIHIRPISLLKQSTYAANDYFEEKAWIFDLTEAEEEELGDFEIGEALREKERVIAPRATRRKPQGNEPMEVDLHIGALLDDTRGMSAKEMLDYQMNVFRQTMEAYRHERGRKIVFIHGKGEGVLRQEILKALKAKYPHCKAQDASFRQYGFGATLVEIR